jgi:hypothetical protein
MRPAYLKPIRTRRPLVCIVHDWAVRAVLAVALLAAAGYAFEAGRMLWQVLR